MSICFISKGYSRACFLKIGAMKFPSLLVYNLNLPNQGDYRQLNLYKMSRHYNYKDEDDDFDDGWDRQYGESDEDYQERMDDWNDRMEYNND